MTEIEVEDLYLGDFPLPQYEEQTPSDRIDILTGMSDDDLLDIIDETVRTEEEELADLSEDLLMKLIKRQFDKEYDSFMEIMYWYKGLVMDRLRPELIEVYKWTMGQLIKYGQVFSRHRRDGGELAAHLKGRTKVNPLLVREDMRKKLKVSSSLQVMKTVEEVLCNEGQLHETDGDEEEHRRRRVEAMHTVDALVWEQIDQECLYIAYEHNRIVEWRTARDKTQGKMKDELMDIDNRISHWA